MPNGRSKNAFCGGESRSTDASSKNITLGLHSAAAVYSCTKFAVVAISEGLRLENDRTRVAVISPGVTDSELAESISADGAREATTMQIERGLMDSERFKRGWETLKQIDGEQGERVISSLRDISPDFATYLIEFPFGDIYSRPGLDLKTRELAVVAALTAMGNATPQLKVHIQGAMNVGSSRQEVIEVIIQMAVYAGFPAALNGLFAAKMSFRSTTRLTLLGSKPYRVGSSVN